MVIVFIMNSTKTPIFITGGAGFIGSNFIMDWVNHIGTPVINIDKLTYTGNLCNLQSLHNNSLHKFVRADLSDSTIVEPLLNTHKPLTVINFAAESHVDRSIHDPKDFIQTNVIGTFHLLQSVRRYYESLPAELKNDFRFLHVSTDEVYGTLSLNDPPFTESNRYAPNNPYAASKAASDHFVRAWHHTFKLPTLITNCSNNYGPYQFPEKFIPLIIVNALNSKNIPIYGDGRQIRDWLYVADHCDAIRTILRHGKIGHTYNIGGRNEKANIDIVHLICDRLDTIRPRADKKSYREQIIFVADRPGHDRRYAIDARKIEAELNWKPKETFETGITKTIDWYLTNPEWLDAIANGDYKKGIDTNYAEKT